MQSASEHAMIALFLQSEWHSPKRWQPVIHDYLESHHLDSEIITSPDTENPAENAKRLAIFDSYRHYTARIDLFEGFPQDVKWHHGTITLNNLRQVQYIDYSYWNKLSDGTRLAMNAVANIWADKRIYDVSNDGFRHLAMLLRDGASFPPLILVSTDAEDTLVVLEGHARLTAYMLASDNVPDSLLVMIGLSPQMTQWVYF
ncbi:MAG: hypothetical protein ACPG7F_22085 [Aggregatilineales bacterium]